MDTTSTSDRFYAVVSLSLLKPEWSDLSRFKFNPVFSLGIDREFLDPDYDQYTSCLEGIPDLSVLLEDENEDPAVVANPDIVPVAPEPPPKRAKLSLKWKNNSAVAVSSLSKSTAKREDQQR